MGCFCCGSQSSHLLPNDSKEPNVDERANNDRIPTTKLQEFTFQKLADATQNFSPKCLVGESSFRQAYRGKLRENVEIVSVQYLDNHREFLLKVTTLSFLNHPNLINLIGYCVEGDKRFLVHECLPLASLDQHLHDRSKPPLDWYTRMKIALGIARGLECLHHTASPPIICRNLKPSNILLDNDFNAKLSDFGLSKLEPSVEDKFFIGSLPGTYGYLAPEYIEKGILTVKADLYSFGVVLLELVTGRRGVDSSNRNRTEKQTLVYWARPKLKKPKKFPELADPRLQGNFPTAGFNQALAVAVKCLRKKEAARPMMSDVVAAIMCLTSDDRLL